MNARACLLDSYQENKLTAIYLIENRLIIHNKPSFHMQDQNCAEHLVRLTADLLHWLEADPCKHHHLREGSSFSSFVTGGAWFFSTSSLSGRLIDSLPCDFSNSFALANVPGGCGFPASATRIGCVWQASEVLRNFKLQSRFVSPLL